MSAVIVGITHHEKPQGDKIQEKKNNHPPSTNQPHYDNLTRKQIYKPRYDDYKKSTNQPWSPLTIAAADQYEKIRQVSGESYSRSRDSRVRFTDRHTSGESNRDRSLSQSRNSSPYHVSDYHSPGRRDRTDSTVDKEITTDPDFHQITTIDIKCVITATNIYSNSITLATILEPLKIEKKPAISVTEEDILQENVGQIWHVPTTQVPDKQHKTNT
ncbi:hypothetical protein OUZ56_026494 [Daphnia magna]|uniref:Uncharacterized protein n=1 Tax=Daphnia magna TaxID=35525 RepID=A0ABQ9ZMQ1_9CRUS|nr:hypothetical protein OUZ56_026494 [Daphnia magna]